MRDPEAIAFERERARTFCWYMLCREVDPARRDALATASDAELREVVAAHPDHPLAAGAAAALDLIHVNQWRGVQ